MSEQEKYLWYQSLYTVYNNEFLNQFFLLNFTGKKHAG